ncbi:hypothetical protein [Ferruginibacter sp.]|nr:hypothetical protein [Ferruginibacter sp.]
MKKLLSFLTLLFVLTIAHAQVKTVSAIVKGPKRTIVNRTTGQRGYSNVNIKVALTLTEGKGETLKFTSNTAIEKAELSFAGIPNSKQITTYNADTKDGQFYLQSDAYKGGLAKGYLVHFFVKDFDKPVWVCVLTERK